MGFSCIPLIMNPLPLILNPTLPPPPPNTKYAQYSIIYHIMRVFNVREVGGGKS